MNQSIQLAKLTIALEEIKQRIYSEILPLCAHLAPEETAEISQSLELSAQTIEAHQNKFRLQAVEVRQ